MRKHIFSKLNKRLLSVFIAVLTLFSSTYTIAFAAGGNQAVAGKVYEFDKDSHYEFSCSPLPVTYLRFLHRMECRDLE